MSYNKDYYLKHKEEILERNRKWRQENKEKFYEILYSNRRKKAKELKEQGIKYNWHTKKEREKLYEKYYERINRRNQEKENNVDVEQ